MRKPPLLLLADDDADDRDMFSDALKEFNPEAKLITVKDGTGVVEFVKNLPADEVPLAVILDYNMPNMNGPQVLDWLCKKPEFEGMAKFVWSTAAQQEYIASCKKKGALEYFVKPNNEQGLRAIIQKIMDIISRENKV